MSSLLDTTGSGVHKKGAYSASHYGRDEGLVEDLTAEDVKENDAPETRSDKKTDTCTAPPPQQSLLWRMGSGLYGTTTGVVGGAVGLGVGGVKWAAGKSYDAGSAVLSTTVTTTKAVANKVPRWKTKDKKE